MVDFLLTEEQREIQRMARNFAEKELSSAGKDADHISDPAHSFPWRVVKQAVQLGLTTMLIPEEFGGGGMGDFELALVIEEVARGDAGVAMSLLLTAAVAKAIAQKGSDWQREKWLNQICADESGTFLLASSSSEPNVATSDNWCPQPDPSFGIRATARREGDGYFINGRKCFCSNGGVARAYLVQARLDLSKPMKETASRFLVFDPTPGFSVGRVEDKMGLRSLQLSELILDEVYVPSENLLGGEGGGSSVGGVLFETLCPTTGAVAVGIATAAYELALQYSRERRSWGKPLISHQAIEFRLADMRMNIEAARGLIWKACWANDRGCSDSPLNAMAKIFATDMAQKVALESMQILGAYGYMKDYPAEKYLRDANGLWIAEGTNDIQRSKVMRDVV
jgi:alkylation response protein AidB-like acyl-CoA dehydrogenase